MTEQGPGDGGVMFGPYRLDALLGRGGMGEVWRAFDTRRERPVALKRLSGAWVDDPEFRDRFRREAQVTARLQSGHVVPIYDFGEIDGRLYLDMRLVSGGDLATLMAAHPGGLPPARVVEIVRQVAAALEAAHGEGLVHRDVKPSNVLLEPQGRRDFAYLVDFGIAKAATDASARLTATGSTLGSPPYMAPELFTSAGAASAASDVYALGCVLYEMLTGTRAFAGPDAAVLLHQHLYASPPAPSAVHPGLAGFDPVVANALAKDPRARYATPGALAEAAAAVPAAGSAAGSAAPATGPSEAVTVADPPVDDDPTGRTDPTLPGAPPPGMSPPDGRPRRGRNRALWLGAVAALLVVAAVVVTGVVLLGDGGGSTGADARPVACAGAPPVSGAEPPQQRVPIRIAAPTGVAFAPDGCHAYVLAATGDRAGSLEILDTTADAVTAVVSLGARPRSVAVSPDGRELYVAAVGGETAPDNRVLVVDTAARAVVASITVEAGPIAVAFTPDGRQVYVANYGTAEVPGSTVSVIDTATRTVAGTVVVGNRVGPFRIAFSPDGRRAYVSIYGGKSAVGIAVKVIDTASRATTATIPAGRRPLGLAITHDGRRLYVANVGSDPEPDGSLQVLDTATESVVATLPPTVVDPYDAALTFDDATLVVTARDTDGPPDGLVYVIDTATTTVRRTVALRGEPVDVAIAPDGRHALVTTTVGGDGVWRLTLP